MVKTLNINLNVNMDFKAIKLKNKTCIFLFNEKLFIKLFLPDNTQYFYIIGVSTLVIKYNFIKNNVKLIQSSFNDLIFSINFLWHVKIKFNGKGFKVKRFKPKQSMKFYFYRSHLTVFVFKNVKLIKRHKYKFLVFKSNKKLLKKMTKLLISIRPINIYTKRGLRASREVIFKRTGKKSSYV